MSSTYHIKSELAARYSLALLELAAEDKSLPAVENDLRAFSKMCEESKDLRFLLTCPTIGTKAKVEAIEALGKAAGFTKTTNEFLGTVAKNNRLFALEDMISAFFKALATKNGVISVSVTSATELPSSAKDELSASLKAAFGKTIDLSIKVDERLLGGLMVRIGSLLIDSSLKTQVQQLKMVMKGA